MAVRITVSIPDALAKRMKPHKQLIYPSELMQSALIEQLNELEGVGLDDVLEDLIASFAKSLTRRKKARLIAKLHEKNELSHAEQEFLLEVGKLRM
jgi:hypothetical protein